MRYDYIILGAGITGMSCAERLKQKEPDATILILEKESYTGGLSRSLSYKDWQLDLGPHRLYTPYQSVEKYLKELLKKELLTVKRSSAMYLHDKFVNYPFQVPNLLFSLSPIRAMQYMGSFLSQKLSDLRIPANSPGKILQEFSYTGYLKTRFGSRIAEDVFYPYAQKVWGLKPENLSSWILKKRVSSPNLSALMSSLLSSRQRESQVREEFQYPRLGMQQMIDRMEQRCRQKNIGFSLNNKASLLKRKPQHWEVTTLQGIYESQRVISTVPITEMINLTNNRFIREDKKLRQSFRSLNFRKILFVYIFLSRSPEDFKSWYYFPRTDIIFSRISNLKLFSEEIGPPHQTVLCCEIPMAMDKTPDSNTEDTVARDLEKTGLIQKEEIQDAYCHSEPFCYPVYDLIFEAKLKLIFQYLSRLTNLISTGRQGLFHHNNIDHAILMGWRAADYCHNSGFIIDLPRWYFQTIRTFDRFKIID